MRANAPVASDEALLLQAGEDSMDRRQSELSIREYVAELGGTQFVVM